MSLTQTLLGPQPRFGDKQLRVVCPQNGLWSYKVVCPPNGTAVLKGLRPLSSHRVAIIFSELDFFPGPEGFKVADTKERCFREKKLI